MDKLSNTCRIRYRTNYHVSLQIKKRKEIKGNCYRIKEKESKRHKPENKRISSRFVIYFLPLLFISIKT